MSGTLTADTAVQNPGSYPQLRAQLLGVLGIGLGQRTLSGSTTSVYEQIRKLPAASEYVLHTVGLIRQYGGH